MKIFAVLALATSSVLGGTIQFPSLSWDDAKLQSEAQRWTTYQKAHELDVKADQQKTAVDLAKAFASYQTQVAVNYGKVMYPFAKLKADYFNYITVDGRCNTTAAEACVYQTYGLEGPKMNHTQFK